MTAGPRLVLEQRLADRKAVHVGEGHVQEHKLRFERPRQRERRRPVRCLSDDGEPLSLEKRTGEGPEAGVVIDDEDSRGHA